MLLMFVPLGMYVFFIIAAVLIGVLVFMFIVNTGKALPLVPWFALAIVPMLGAAIWIRLRFHISVSGIQIHEHGIQQISPNENQIIHWNEINEIRHEQNRWSFNTLRREKDESREEFRDRWNDNTSKLSLIGQDDKTLLVIHGSNYKHFSEIRDEITRHVDETLGVSSRNLVKERERALNGFRIFRRCTVLLAIILIVGNTILMSKQLEWDRHTGHLESNGIQVTAQILTTHSVSEEIVDIEYQFVDLQGVSYSNTVAIDLKSWKKQREPREISVVYDSTDPSLSRPTELDLDTMFASETMRVIVQYIMPALLVLNLFDETRKLIARNYHFETNRYTIVKLGKPKA